LKLQARLAKWENEEGVRKEIIEKEEMEKVRGSKNGKMKRNNSWGGHDGIVQKDKGKEYFIEKAATEKEKNTNNWE